MKYIFILSILISSVSILSAQVQLERQIISPAGQLYEGNESQISATMGEAIVNTAISGSFVITQGFQQTFDSGTTSAADVQRINADFLLYPNPTSDYISVTVSAEEELEIVIRLQDMLGNQLATRVFQQQNQLTAKFDVSDLPAGSYIVSIGDRSGLSHISKQIQVIH